MVLGVGTDIVDVKGFRERMVRTPSLVNRVFSKDERAYCENMAHPWQHFAARFAAKEAVMKAMGTGWSDGIVFVDIEVTKEANGAPHIRLGGEAARFLRNCKGQLKVSISHTNDHAIAFVVLEGR